MTEPVRRRWAQIRFRPFSFQDFAFDMWKLASIQCKDVIERIDALIRPYKTVPGERIEPTCIHHGGPILLTSLVPSGRPKKVPPIYIKKYKPQSSRFLHLPLEIRILILEEILRYPKTKYLKLKPVVITTKRDFAENIGQPYPKFRLRKWPLQRTYWRWVSSYPFTLCPKPLSSGPGVMATCRQLYDESVPILYGKNSFFFSASQWYTLTQIVYLEPILELHRFGCPGAFLFIRSLEFSWPVKSGLHDCEDCKKLWHNVWNVLEAMDQLVCLHIQFLTDFDSWNMRGPNLWREHGVDWLKVKLQRMKQVRKFRLTFQHALAWMTAEMDLDPQIFEFHILPRLEYINWLFYPLVLSSEPYDPVQVANSVSR